MAAYDKSIAHLDKPFLQGLLVKTVLKNLHFHTTKIIKLCQHKHICVYLGMYIVMLQGMELKLGMGKGDRSPRLKKHIFEVTLSKNKCHPKLKLQLEAKLLRNDIWLPNFIGRTPDQCNALLGSKAMQGSARVNVRSYCLKCPIITKFGRKNPDQSNALLGSTTGQIA